jgi:hypothetical protein
VVLAMAVPLMAMVSGAWAADKIRMSSRATNWDLVLLESGVAEKYDLDVEIVPEKAARTWRMPLWAALSTSPVLALPRWFPC